MTSRFKIRTLLYLSFSLIITSQLNGQVKSGTAEVKTLKKVVYGGTYSLPDGNPVLFFQEKDELVAYEFNKDAQFVTAHNGSEANNMLNKVDYKESTVSKQLNATEIKAGLGLKVMYAKESWGSLKLVDGLIYLSSTDKFINGF